MCREVNSGNMKQRKSFTSYKFDRLELKSVQYAAYIEDITQWREDMNFMFEWQEQYLTSEGSKFISSS